MADVENTLNDDDFLVILLIHQKNTPIKRNFSVGLYNFARGVLKMMSFLEILLIHQKKALSSIENENA